MNHRRYSFIDHFIMHMDDSLSTLYTHLSSKRNYPAHAIEEPILTSQEKKESIGYMRVNHTGEVCAQALYRGHIIAVRSNSVHNLLQKAVIEETDHLAWCHERLRELGGHRSYLNMLWYWNAFFIGVLAGIAGDSWSLGFV